MTKPVTPFDEILANALNANALLASKLPSWRDPIWHRGFRIYYDKTPVAGNDWHYVHDDYDGADDARDNRAGTEASLEACRTEIDERFFDGLPEIKTQTTLAAEGFALTVRLSGYGADNGSGEIHVDEKDVDWQPHDDRDGCYLVLKIDRADLTGLRDWLMAELAKAEAPR